MQGIPQGGGDNSPHHIQAEYIEESNSRGEGAQTAHRLADALSYIQSLLGAALVPARRRARVSARLVRPSTAASSSGEGSTRAPPRAPRGRLHHGGALRGSPFSSFLNIATENTFVFHGAFHDDQRLRYSCTLMRETRSGCCTNNGVLNSFLPGQYSAVELASRAVIAIVPSISH